MLGILALLGIIPVVSLTFAPERDAAAIGYYEQVRLQAQSDEGARAIGGFVAPEGWLWVDPYVRESFHSPDGEVTVTHQLLAAVDDPAATLRADAPAGAVAVPVVTGATSAGFATYTLEYDLAAGHEPVQLLLVCSTLTTKTDCVRLDLTGDATGAWESAIHELIESVEVI